MTVGLKMLFISLGSTYHAELSHTCQGMSSFGNHTSRHLRLQQCHQYPSQFVKEKMVVEINTKRQQLLTLKHILIFSDHRLIISIYVTRIGVSNRLVTAAIQIKKFFNGSNKPHIGCISQKINLEANLMLD